MATHSERINTLAAFLEETVNYFLVKVEHVDRDRYSADRDKGTIAFN